MQRGLTLVEAVLSMLTGVCYLQKVLHRVWAYFPARLAFTLAAFNVLAWTRRRLAARWSCLPRKFYTEQGRLAEAVSLEERALHIQEIALSPSDPAVAETLQDLAELYEKMGKHDKAEQILARARSAALED